MNNATIASLHGLCRILLQCLKKSKFYKNTAHKTTSKMTMNPQAAAAALSAQTAGVKEKPAASAAAVVLLII